MKAGVSRGGCLEDGVAAAETLRVRKSWRGEGSNGRESLEIGCQQGN